MFQRKLSTDSSQEELVVIEIKEEIPWIQQKNQEVFISRGLGLK